jgi:large subunit ribosomal protein L32e
MTVASQEEHIEKALALRAARKRKKPKFRRQEWFRYKRLGSCWRAPRGLHSKLRKGLKYRIKKPSIGYGAPRAAKYRHPSGFYERLVHRPEDLEGIDPKVYVVRIAHSVGMKKRAAIVAKAEQLGIRVLNAGGV